MKTYLKQLNKKLLICVAIIITMLSFVILKTNSSYALDTKIYTRKQMQEMIVSTALSLYYNNYFSDYGQRAMDNLGNEENYFNYGNFLWRDLNVTPEEVGYSKYYHIDCSGYNFLIYKNTIGYDLSEYNIVNRYLLFYQDRKNYPLARVSFYSGDERLKYYKEAYTRFGYGWNSGFLGTVARKISGNCSTSNCTQGKENTKPFIYNNLDNKDKNELVYYYESNGYRDLKTIQEAYAIAEKKLQPGDIISYTKSDNSGHVMFYAGNATDIDENHTGYSDLLLHSTGNGGGDYTTSVTSVNNKLRKKTSIVDDSASEFLDGKDGRFASVYKTTGSYVLRFAIYRPLNTICTDDNNCKINNNTYNAKLTETQLKNNEARVALKKNQVQQYMILEKTYNSSLTPTTDKEDGKTRNIISEYNSININDNLTFKLRIRNKLDNKKTENIKIEAEIPEKTTYIENSCNNNCRKEGNKLIWDEFIIEGLNEKKDFTFKVKAEEEGTITYKGFKVNVIDKNNSSNNKELQMSQLNIKVEPTQNGINKEILLNTINDFQKLVERGQIIYASNGTHSQNIQSLKELLNNPTQTISTSEFGYIKMIYYNAFGLDLDMLDEEVDVINTTKVKNAIFTNVPYPERNNFLSKGEDGLYPKYTGDTSVLIYARKLKKDTSALTGVKKSIAEMLVPGLYGGKHLKGNDLGDRTKFLRSFINNSAYQSDLEVGDIIISYKTDPNTNIEIAQIYLYLGDDENGPVLTKFTNSSNNNGVLLYYTDKYLNTYYSDASLRANVNNKPSNQILNELFNQDLFVILRPSKLGTTVSYDYNDGIEGTPSYVAYDTYKNLVTPIKKDYKLILEFNDQNIKNIENTYIGKNSFNSWCIDENLKNCITNTSKLSEKKHHTLYAKWNQTTITLPQLTKTGHKHEGWYSDKNLTNKVAEPNTEYKIEKDLVLYAKWIANNYQVKYDANGGTGVMSNSNHTYDIESKLNTNNYVKEGYTFGGWSTTPTGTIEYLNEQSIKNITSSEEIVTLYAIWREKNNTEVSVEINAINGESYPIKKIITKNSNALFQITNNIGYSNPKVECTNNQTATISGNELTVNNVTEDTVCTIKYAPIQYIVKYNSNGGSGSMSSRYFTYDKSAKLSKNTFTKSGYTFRGWATEKDLQTQTITYINEESVKNLTTKSETINLYAIWNLVDYNINYNLNDATFSPSPTKYNVETKDFTLNQPIKPGYKFIGWTGSNGTIPQLVVTIKKGTFGDLNYTANWEKEKYTINYKSDENGKITGITSEEVEYGDKPSGTTWSYNDGYNHLKWSADVNVTLDNGYTILKGDEITMERIKRIVVSSNITLTTYHYKTKYIVKYIAGENGGISGITSEEVPNNQTILGTTTIPNEGYEFSHWLSNQDVVLNDSTTIIKNTAITNEQLTKIIAINNLELTAQFKIKTYTINYISDNNGVISGITSEYKAYQQNPSSTTTIPNQNYIFISWTADKDITLKDGTIIKKGEEISNNQIQEIVINNDLIFTANHKKEKLKVHYKESTGITIDGESSEDINYGTSPNIVKYNAKDTNRKIAFIADKDVTLNDGTIIKSGIKISLEQYQQLKITEDLIVTITYSEEKIPNTNVKPNIIIKILFVILIIISLIVTFVLIKKLTKKQIKNSC